MRARGRTARRRDGEMNGYERAYAGDLEILRARGELAHWLFEPVKLRLAAKTYYAPDFLVVRADGALEFHEVKGFWREDARVKIKVAAELYPMFRFLGIQLRAQAKKRGGGITIVKQEEF